MKNEKLNCKDVMAHICENIGPKFIAIKANLESFPNFKNYFNSVETTIKFYKEYNVNLSDDAHDRLLSKLGLKE